MGIVEQLRNHALSDPSDEREVMHAPLLREAADWIERLRAENETLRAEGGGAIDALREAPRAVSAEADFDALTWTFKVKPNCRIAAGIYALVWMGPNAEITGG